MNENIAQQLLEEMKEIKSNMASMQENVNSIESSMATKQDVERIDNQLDSITKHIVHNSEQLSKLSEKQDLKQLETINDSKERQEKILETLALRSIEQEGALKDLHRAK